MITFINLTFAFSQCKGSLHKWLFESKELFSCTPDSKVHQGCEHKFLVLSIIGSVLSQHSSCHMLLPSHIVGTHFIYLAATSAICFRLEVRLSNSSLVWSILVKYGMRD